MMLFCCRQTDPAVWSSVWRRRRWLCVSTWSGPWDCCQRWQYDPHSETKLWDVVCHDHHPALLLDYWMWAGFWTGFIRGICQVKVIALYTRNRVMCSDENDDLLMKIITGHHSMIQQSTHNKDWFKTRLYVVRDLQIFVFIY